MAQITLHDLAKKLNISVSTVSKALKDYPDVSEKTKKKVLNLADKLNFTPNIVASNLRTQHTKTIGVIIPNIVHDFFSKVIGGIIDEAEKNGYMVILLQSNEKYELEQKQLNLLIQQQVDGILLSLTAETTKFKPTVITKFNNGAQATYDFTINFLFNEKFWIGTSYRVNDASNFGAMMDYQVSRDFRVGYAYDLPTSTVRPYTGGTHEIILIYELFKKVLGPVKSPRYF